MLLEMLHDTKIKESLNWPDQKLADYLSFKYELCGKDLSSLLNLLGVTEEEYKQVHFQDLVKILYTEGSGFYFSPTCVIHCSGCRIVTESSVITLYGPTTLTQCSTTARALEYLVRFIRREIKL